MLQGMGGFGIRCNKCPGLLWGKVRGKVRGKDFGNGMPQSALEGNSGTGSGEGFRKTLRWNVPGCSGA